MNTYDTTNYQERNELLPQFVLNLIEEGGLTIKVEDLAFEH